MKEQTSAYLDKSRELLGDAETMLRANLNEAAGRTAYLAGFHAAQALLFETTGRIHKTHSGLLEREDDMRVDNQARAFSGNAYGTSRLSEPVWGSMADAGLSNAPAG